MKVKIQAIDPIEATPENIKWVQNYGEKIEWESIVEYNYRTIKNRKGKHRHVYLSVILPESELHPDTGPEYKLRNKYEL